MSILYNDTMTLKENKYFIFDNPVRVTFKYCVKCVLRVFLCVFYKAKLNIFAPKKHPPKKYDVAICAIFKDEATYIKEWLEFHLLVGVEHFYLYNNFSSDDYMSVLLPYMKEGLVTLTQWEVPQGQMAAYSDCVKRFSFETQWLGFVDLDEFVVPNDYDTIGEFLKGFAKRPVVIVYWRYFGSSGLVKRDTKELVSKDFTSCWHKYADIGKVFFNTDYEYQMPYTQYMHYRWARFKNHKLPPVNCFDKVCIYGTNPVPHKTPTHHFPIQMNHYLLKSFEECEKKCEKGDAVYKKSPKTSSNIVYFSQHERYCQQQDTHIVRFLVDLQLALKKRNSIITGGGGHFSVFLARGTRQRLAKFPFKRTRKRLA